MVSIVTTTYYPNTDLGWKRQEEFRHVVLSWINNIRYETKLRLIIADDGSETDFRDWTTRQERKGIGASLNAGFKMAFEKSDIAMYIVDDWMLHSEIDINPWVEMLKMNEHIGMVRLVPPHPHLTGIIELLSQGWIMILDRHDFAYGMRPALYHKRFFEAYGWFQEGINCWECERLYNLHFCESEGPEIVYALPCPWTHEDILPLGTIEPEGVKCQN